MELYSPQRARRALFYTIGFRAVSQVATVLSYVVLVRGLSEQALGVYSLLYSVIPIVGTVASFGLDQVLKRFQPEYLRAGNTAAAAWLVRVVTASRFVSNVVLLLVIIAAWNIVSRPFHLTGHRQDFEVFSLVVLLNFQVILLQSSLAAHMQQRYSVGSVAVLGIGKLVAYCLVYECFLFTLRAALIGDLAAFALTYGYLLISHWRHTRPADKELSWCPVAAERKRLWRYALTNNFNESSSLLLYVQTDNFFIAALMSPLAVGAYAFYARLNEMAANLIPTRLFENVVQPLFYSTRQEEAAQRLPRYVTLLINISMLVQWPLFAFSLVYHKELVVLVFHGKFVEYSNLLPLVVGFAVTSSVISTPITMTALYGERPSLILRSQLFAIYQVVAMFTLVPLFGLYGAAIATGTLHLFRNLWVWWHVRNTARWLNVRAALGVGCVIWGVAIALCFGIKFVWHTPPLVQLLIGAVVCVIGTLVYLRSAAMAQSDREIIAGVLHGRESRILRWVGLAPQGGAAAISAGGGSG
ncbi:MAG TPA: lipopolysaccharide biosynthesis protein [Steroidobacteraceae bacterium]